MGTPEERPTAPALPRDVLAHRPREELGLLAHEGDGVEPVDAVETVRESSPADGSDGTGVGFVKPTQELRHRALPRAAAAHERGGLPATQREVHAPQDVRVRPSRVGKTHVLQRHVARPRRVPRAVRARSRPLEPARRRLPSSSPRVSSSSVSSVIASTRSIPSHPRRVRMRLVTSEVARFNAAFAAFASARVLTTPCVTKMSPGK